MRQCDPVMSRASLEPPPPPEIQALEPIDYLISNYELGEKFLDELPPESRTIAEPILSSARKLKETTGWDAEKLVVWLGCPTNTVKEFGDLLPERLEISKQYLSYLEQLSERIEVQFDKRMLVLGFGRLYIRAGEDIAKVRSAFEVERDFSANEYLNLGEVQRALDTALVVIDPGSEDEIVTPFDNLDPVHISTGRLDALIKREREFASDTLGEVAVRMEEHIHGTDGTGACSGCKAAYVHRQEQLHRSTEIAEHR